MVVRALSGAPETWDDMIGSNAARQRRLREEGLGRAAVTAPIGTEAMSSGPGQDGAASNPAEPASASDVVGVWGIGLQRRVELVAGAHRSSHLTAEEAEAAALHGAGAAVVIAMPYERTTAYSVYDLHAPDAFSEFTRVNVETLGGNTNVRAAADVHAYVTTDGFLARPAGLVGAFDDDVLLDRWEGAGGEALGDDPIPSFERAMRGMMEALLAMALEGAGEQADVDPSVAVPVAERVVALDGEIGPRERERWLLVSVPDREPGGGLDPNVPGIQRRIRVIEAELAALYAERAATIAEFPLLRAVDEQHGLAAFLAADATRQGEMFSDGETSILVAVHHTASALHHGDLDLWALPPLVLGTLEMIGVPEEDPARQVVLDEMARRERQDRYFDWAMTVLQLGSAVLAAVAPVGVATAALVVGAGAGLMDAAWMTQAYLADQDLARLSAGDAEVALIDPDTLGPRGFFVAMAWIGLGLDALDVFEVAKVLGRIPTARPDRIRSVVREFAERVGRDPEELLDAIASPEGVVISPEHLGVLSAQLRAPVSVDDALGDGVRIVVDDAFAATAVRVGPDAQLFDLLAHQPTIELLRRYEGIAGRLRGRWDTLVEAAGGASARCPFDEGTPEWRAWHEIPKLQLILDNLRERLAKTVDDALVHDLRSEERFLDAQIRDFERTLEDGVARSDPRFVERVTQSTEEAYAQGFPRFDTCDLIDADAAKYYWYQANPKGDPPYLVYRDAGRGPKLELERVGDRWALRLADESDKPAHVFPSNTTKEQALAFLMQDGKSTRPFVEMLEAWGIARREEVIGIMPDPEGLSEEVVRHFVKARYEGEVIERMFVDGEAILTREASYETYRAMTRDLNSSDAGKFGEKWYARYMRDFEGKRLEPHPNYTDDTGKERFPDFFEAGATIRGNTLVEVKATKDGLNTTHDVPQIDQALRLARKKGKVKMGGTEQPIHQVRVVFLHAEGARGSIGPIEDWLMFFKDELAVEVFFDAGPRTFRDIDDFKSALGVS